MGCVDRGVGICVGVLRCLMEGDLEYGWIILSVEEFVLECCVAKGQ